jgi:hypothetical protein
MRAAALENSFAYCVFMLSRRQKEFGEFCRSSIILNLSYSKVLRKISECVWLPFGMFFCLRNSIGNTLRIKIYTELLLLSRLTKMFRKCKIFELQIVFWVQITLINSLISYPLNEARIWSWAFTYFSIWQEIVIMQNQTTWIKPREKANRIVCYPVNIWIWHIQNLEPEFYCYYNLVGDIWNTIRWYLSV